MTLPPGAGGQFISCPCLGRFHPFATPSGNGRFLRKVDDWCRRSSGSFVTVPEQAKRHNTARS
jgi:hypothetical protein